MSGMWKRSHGRTTKAPPEMSDDVFTKILHWEWEVPYVLEKHRLLDQELLDQEESRKVYDALERGSDPEAFLRPLVQKAYFRYYGWSEATH